MHSPDLGYLPREVGLLGHLLEFRGSSFRKSFCHLPLRLILKLSIQSYVYSVVYMASHDPSKYQFSTSTYVIMFTTLLTAYYVYVFRIRIPFVLTALVQVGYFDVPKE
jgi:hypothetical protein